MGRPCLPVGTRAVDLTVVKRIPKDVFHKIDSGYYDRLERLLVDYMYLSEDASSTSPRYEKLRSLLQDYSVIVTECKVSLTNR